MGLGAWGGVTKFDFSGNSYRQRSNIERGCGGVDSPSLKELSSMIFLFYSRSKDFRKMLKLYFTLDVLEWFI